MDPQLWSGLPRDLLLCIFKFSVQDLHMRQIDEGFWQKWLNVARGNSLLHRAVLVQQWKFVSLSWEDLLLDPIELQHKSTSRSKTASRKLLNQRLAKNVSSGLVHQLLHADHGLYPAQLTHILEIDLSMSCRDFSKLPRLSHRTISRTTNAILPEMRSLRILNINGAPSNTVFETISGQEFSKLHVLQVGLGSTSRPYHSYPGDVSFDIYDWSKLTSLKSLTKLTSRQFSEEQCQDFRQLIACLPNLQELDLESVMEKLDRPSEGQHSPLQILLGPYEVISDTSDPESKPSVLTKLSTSFRRLQLLDNHHNGPNQLQAPLLSHMDHISLSRCRIEELITCLEDPYTVRNLSQWLKRDTLKLLVFSPVLLMSSENSHDLSAVLELTNAIIAAHQESLQEIIFNYAWTILPNFADAFNKQWKDQFTISDIALPIQVPPNELISGSDSGSDLNSDSDSDSYDDNPVHFCDLNYPGSFFGCPKDTNRWGSSLQRVKIVSEKCPHKKGFDIIDLLEDPNTQQLRVLIIGPCPWFHTCTRIKGHNQWVADSFLSSAPATLRYIQICNDVYWIHYSKKNVAIAQLFDPSNTSSGNHHASIIQDYQSWQNREDVEFIDAHSGLKYNGRDPYAKVYPSRPYGYWLPSSEFLVARRQDV